ncbi:MAG: YceI family protein [Chloroflexi bacterium]|nr:YceI family protein [Chloroflexota bacterium]
MLQNRTVRIVLALIVLAALAGAAAFLYIWFSGGSGQPSAPISAPTLPADASASDARTLLRIVPEESAVRFIINETLFGAPTTVVGETNQVAGDLLVDFSMPSNSEIGTIRINMATIATDNEFRNRALRGQILQSSRPEFEFAEFAPTALTGLPDTLTIGTPINFQITGNLTVRGVTQEVTFAATVTAASETRLEGSASAQVLYTDFDMTIPNARGVADVTEEVQLEIDFVAAVVTADTQATPSG